MKFILSSMKFKIIESLIKIFKNHGTLNSKGALNDKLSSINKSIQSNYYKGVLVIFVDKNYSCF